MSIKTIPYGFIPTQVLGCSLWLDAADSSTVTLSGSTATQWNDKSGNGRNSTSCSATYSNRINGLSCMTNPIISGPITNSGSSIVTIFIELTNTIKNLELKSFSVEQNAFVNGKMERIL